MSEPQEPIPSETPPPSGPPAPPAKDATLADDPVRTWGLRGIFLALVLWGLYHTLGVFLYNHDPRKAAIVFGCSAVFLLFWAALLYLRPPAAAS